METSERTLDVNGIRMHLTEAGDPAAPPLLLLHGIGAAASMHLDLVAGWAAEGFRVLAPDLRGHGRTTRPPAYSMGDHVADLTGLLDALALPSAGVVGVSMGSYLAQALVVAAPERVDALVLVVSQPDGTTSASARYLAEHADEVEGLSTEEQQLWLAQRMFAPDSGDGPRQRALAWFAAQQEAGLALDEAQLQAANDALAGFDFRPDLPRVAVPTLVVSGRHDVLNPPERGRAIADLVPGSRFEVFEHSGHLLPGEEPDRLVALVAAFLADAAQR
jgi:3-oxoadipate enol-lactonase